MAELSLSTRDKTRTSHIPYPIGALVENNLEEIINTFDPIQLQEMEAVALLNRIDTKYVISTSQLTIVLQNLQPHYRVLAIDHHRIHHYRTLYFDTQAFDLYHAHVTGRSNIYKVRSREYLDTQLAYLEVKHKNQKRRTEKSRLPISYHSRHLDRQMQDFLRGFIPCTGQDLAPKLWNTFKRITLVNKSALERLTIDLELRFFNERQVLDLDGIAIAEIKQDQFSRSSAFVSEMRCLGVRKAGFSKYCFGISQLYPTVKANSQKERVLLIEKLQHGGQSHGCFA